MLKLVASLAVIVLFATTPFGQSTTEVSGLSSSVTVRRDGRWIPYIKAANERDLYFGQGYETARDRLFQMDLMRRLARGETAEIFGKAALEEDKRWRRFNFAKVADESYRIMAPDLKRSLDAYTDGVNAYLASLEAASLPVECKILQYRPANWKPTDSIIIGKVLADALSTTWRADLTAAVLQKLPAEKAAHLADIVTPYDVVLFGSDTKTASATAVANPVPVSDDLLAFASADELVRKASLERVGLHAEELAASNNFVISGKRTVDGKPILANDPHLSPTAPGIWYLTHLSTKDFRAAGVTFPGVPGVILGHNDHIAWGATNVGPDVQDLYLETFNDKGEYKTPTGWVASVKRIEKINVRANPLDPKIEVVELEVIETRNGPVIFEEGDKKYALKWTAFDPKNNDFEAFHRFNRAKDWNEFTAALRGYGGAAQNFVFADTKGNIGWYAASKIPIRRKGEGLTPYDGSTSDGDWIGMIPFEELPHLYNPPSGLIVTANQRIVGTGYKYQQMSRAAASPWRARRLYDLLDREGKRSTKDASDAMFDAFSVPLNLLARKITGSGAAAKETLDDLASWDGNMAPDSRAALIANDIRACMANRMADANRPVPEYIVRERILEKAIRQNLTVWLPAGTGSFDELMRSCDEAVQKSLGDAKRYGPDRKNWVWGKYWQSRFSHPLASAPFIGAQFAAPTQPISGSGHTPNVGSAVSMRHIAIPGNWDQTSLVIPLGQSGDPKSPYFKDQFSAWAAGSMLTFPFSDAAVTSATKSETSLVPKK